jgi:hypothetical protein
MLIEFMKGISPPSLVEATDDAARDERYTAVVALAKAKQEACMTRIEKNVPANKKKKESRTVPTLSCNRS